MAKYATSSIRVKDQEQSFLGMKSMGCGQISAVINNMNGSGTMHFRNEGVNRLITM